MKPANKKPKVFIFGIDGFPPQLVFERYRKDLPTFSRLMEEGCYAQLKTTVPPSSIVAWTTIASGYDPSETGIHSYTRKPGTGLPPRLTNSTDIRVPMLWDVLGRHNRTSVALNIPLTYPARKIKGTMVTDFLTPSFNEKSVYPKSFKKKVEELVGGEYLFDVSGFTGYKKLDPDLLIKRAYEMTRMNFAVAEHLFEKQWDLFFLVLLGGDRLKHVFWRHIDPRHSKFVKNSKYKNVLLDYYRNLDAQLAKFLARLDDATTVIVVSDHGMDRMEQRFNLNDWLRSQGYLVVRKEYEPLYANGPKKLEEEHVDWKKTSAIASGGYQGRIYLRGRSTAKAKKEIVQKLAAVKGSRGQKLDTRIFDTSKIYRKKNKEAPDIIVYFHNLIYGVNNDIGNKGRFSTATSVGVDDAGHAPEGTFIMRSPGVRAYGNLGTLDVMQAAPTILKALDLPEYKKLRGKPLI